MRLAFIVAILATIPADARNPPAGTPVTSTGGMVVCVSPPAAEVGAEVLRKGGNAVDAAVAVGFAQAVTWPEAGNVGGGGFMLVWPGAGKAPAGFDYREMAPAAATADMFAKDDDHLKHRAAGVPGTVRGFALAHTRLGKLPWKDLVMPAVKLAEDGFVVDNALAASLNRVLADKRTTNAEFRRVYGKPGGGTWQAGDTQTLPDLGRTLRAVAEQGPDAFYTGGLAAKIDADMKAGSGLITAADMAKYQAKERVPLRGTYRGYEVLGMPPPSSGGTVVIETLNILENFDLKAKPRYAPETVHLMAEAMRRAYCDRARHLGDPQFTPVAAHLTDKEYAKKLAAGIDPAKATKSETLATDMPLSEGGTETTHYSVVDANGMAVANTYTLEMSFGNRVVVPGAGYILNNEMTDFNHRPGWTDRTGRIGTKPNEVAPGKRMLSSMTPTILLKDGKPVLVTGSPGGRTIPNTVLSILVNVVDYGMPTQAAVDAPRMHQQWFPDRIDHEDFDGFADLSAKLTAMGHKVGRPRRQGDGHSVGIDQATGVRTGAADKRIDGKASTP